MILITNIFVGYLKSNNKVPLSSVKDRSNWLAEPPEVGDYVGILAQDIIQLDFDDESTSTKVMEIVNEYKLRTTVLKTTRGIHLYFKDDGYVKSQSVGIYNAIGLKCDVGLGSKDRVVPLRVTKEVTVKRVINGLEKDVKTNKTKEREWIQLYDELDELPAIFRPIDKYDFGLATTKTRNQTLFNYILKLQTFSFSKEEVRKTTKCINDFILYEPLTDREIDTITRDDAFSEELFFSDRGAFMHDRFGNYMLTNSNIMIIDNQVCIYTKDNIYSNNPNEFERVMLEKIPSLKENQRKEVYKYIMLKVSKKGEYSPAKYLGLKDTILDIETMEEYPYSPRFTINNKIDVAYNPDAYSEVMDKTLDKVACGDKEIRALIEEMIGYTIYRQNSMQVAFILTGEGSNGKSTILNVIKKLVGKQNYTSLDLRELEDTFKPSELYGKLANIGDDISAKYLDNSSVFKKVVTGESFVVQKKYAQPFELESYATQIFCANELPNVQDKSDGFSRRLLIVPFRARFTKKDPDYDPFIEDKLLNDESLEYLLKIAIDGLRRVVFNKEFTTSHKGEQEKLEYLMDNNNVLEWLDSNPKLLNESVADVYLMYRIWCADNGTKPVKKLNLGKEIKKAYGYVSKPQSVDGKVIRVYQLEKGE